jgi:trigger factor
LDETDVDKALERLADNYATYNDVTDRAAELGDYLVLTYTGSLDGTPIAQILPGAELLAQAENHWLHTKDTNFLPGFIDKCLGMKVGEAKSIELEIPAEFPVKEVAGKTLKYEVKLEGLKTKTSVPLDETFAAKLGAPNIETLRNSARDVLTKRKQDEAKTAVRRQVIEHLLADSNFPIPESLLEFETDNAIRSLVEENQKHGVKPETLESQRAELYAAADRDAQQFVRFNFIAEEIAKREKIAPTNEMLFEQLQQYAKSTNQPVEKVYKNFAKRGYPDELLRQLVRALVVEFIIREAVFVDPAPVETPASAPEAEAAHPVATETAAAPVEAPKETSAALDPVKPA